MEVWWKVVRKMQKPLVDRKSGTRAWHAKPHKVAAASTMAVATAIPQTLLPAYMMMGWACSLRVGASPQTICPLAFATPCSVCEPM